MDCDFLRHRVTELRLKKGVSEYQMSLDLGHSRSYIQNIASGRSRPSMEEWLYMCEYLQVTPSAFFDPGTEEPILLQRALDGMRALADKDLLALIGVIERLNDRRR